MARAKMTAKRRPQPNSDQVTPKVEKPKLEEPAANPPCKLELPDAHQSQGFKPLPPEAHDFFMPMPDEHAADFGAMQPQDFATMPQGSGDFAAMPHEAQEFLGKPREPTVLKREARDFTNPNPEFLSMPHEARDFLGLPQEAQDFLSMPHESREYSGFGGQEAQDFLAMPHEARDYMSMPHESRNFTGLVFDPREVKQESKLALHESKDIKGLARVQRTIQNKKAPVKGGRPRTIAYPKDFGGNRKRQLAAMRRAVWEGRMKYTSGRLTKNDLELNSKGAIVPKRRSRHSRVLCKASGMADWYDALREARSRLQLEGFVLVKKSGNAQQQALYRAAIEAMVEKQTQSMNEALQKSGSRMRYQAFDRNAMGACNVAGRPS